MNSAIVTLLTIFLNFACTISIPRSSQDAAVIQTNQCPTGHEVTFPYRPNATTAPSFVLLGGFPLYSNGRTASLSKFVQILPWDWTPEEFFLELLPVGVTLVGNQTYLGFSMTYDEASGDWVTTLPFPSRTFNYAFCPDCAEGWASGNCTAVTDPISHQRAGRW